MSTSNVRLNPSALAAEVDEDALKVFLVDGRELIVPLAWFPKVCDASPEERRNYRLIGRGEGIHWPDLDEDISVASLLGLPD